MLPSRDVSRLIEIMAALRDPVGGCPWDLEQDFRSIRHYTIEEAYEVADAIERDDFADLREELGDLLLQPIYHAQMAREAGHFDIGDVVYAITEKLIRRHPHVFGDVVSDNAGDAQDRCATPTASSLAASTMWRSAAARTASTRRRPASSAWTATGMKSGPATRARGRIWRCVR